MSSLARQVQQQQFHVEETARTYGDSGLKLTRLSRTGSKPYFATTYIGKKFLIIVYYSLDVLWTRAIAVTTDTFKALHYPSVIFKTHFPLSSILIMYISAYIFTVTN